MSRTPPSLCRRYSFVAAKVFLCNTMAWRQGQQAWRAKDRENSPSRRIHHHRIAPSLTTSQAPPSGFQPFWVLVRHDLSLNEYLKFPKRSTAKLSRTSSTLPTYLVLYWLLVLPAGFLLHRQPTAALIICFHCIPLNVYIVPWSLSNRNIVLLLPSCK